MARLLVVDRSQLLAWMVARVAPPGVEVERVGSFRQSERILAEDPPDAVIFNLVPCHLKWRRLLDRCSDESREIPFLCQAVVEHFDACNCSLPCRMEDLIPADLSPGEFCRRISTLLNQGHRPEGSSSSGGRISGDSIRKVPSDQSRK